MKVALLYSAGNERTFEALMGKGEADVSDAFFEFLDLFGPLLTLSGAGRLLMVCRSIGSAQRMEEIPW